MNYIRRFLKVVFKNTNTNSKNNENAMEHLDCTKLDTYIGRTYDADLKAQIEKEFEPYQLMLCDEGRFYCEDHLNERIRCVVEDGKITLIQFH
jgi:hypothetical protein